MCDQAVQRCLLQAKQACRKERADLLCVAFVHLLERLRRVSLQTKQLLLVLGRAGLKCLQSILEQLAALMDDFLQLSVVAAACTQTIVSPERSREHMSHVQLV